MPMCPHDRTIARDARKCAIRVTRVPVALTIEQRCVPAAASRRSLGGEGGGGGADGGKAAPSHTLISGWEQLNHSTSRCL